MTNLAFLIDSALKSKKFEYGLDRYTQEHCQCTLTDKGFRIYRTPNKVYSTDGRVMWGGLQLNIVDGLGYDVFIKGHTYIIAMDVTGQSSTGAGIAFHNYMGWNGGGLTPRPTRLDESIIPNNFNGSKTVYCKFRIDDDVYKKCTSSYSSFVEGTTYLSYKSLSLHWEYTDTGSLGTDIYVDNIRLYDITGDTLGVSVNKSGVLSNLSLYEKKNNQTTINSISELTVDELIEY